MPKIARHFLFILLPVVAAFAILPAVYGNHLLLFNFMIFMMLAQGVNVIYGFTGYLPFGYVGFFGAGAYGFSLMVMHLHAPPLLALAVGAEDTLRFDVVAPATARPGEQWWAIVKVMYFGRVLYSEPVEVTTAELRQASSPLR